MVAAIEERKANTPAGARKRAALLEAMKLKDYEFNAHGVELGQFYESDAIVVGRPRARNRCATPSCTTSRRPCPAAGCRTSGSATRSSTLSTHDLAPYGRFTLLTGTAGQAWVDAAERGRPRARASPLAAVVIGPGHAVTDLYYDWAAQREVRRGRRDPRAARQARRLAVRTLPDRPARGVAGRRSAQILHRAAP